MAKINHNNFVDTVNDIVAQARDREIIHLKNTTNEWKGNSFTIGHKHLINFGTCGYLGLETHPKLIKSACDYAMRYGTQFSISRAYVAADYNLELEDKLSQIFEGHKTLVFSSTSLAHVALIPTLLSNQDAIILDQQTHYSMQTACQIMASKGVPLELIRHNNLEMLERKIQSLRDKHDKIWYVIDGVYSMYGDLAPIDKLNVLAEKYPQLHFYVDDAHGMSWTGKNGCGSVFETVKKNKKTILLTTMAKGFGSVGGIAVFPDKEAYDKVNLHGGALAHSHPVAPSVIGASIASANIHLSDEIYRLQDELNEKISYCNELLDKTDLPILSNPKTPIYFVGTGQPNVGYNLNKRILQAGFYVNIAMFPAVSVKNTGLRFTITNHISKSEIKQFITVLEREFYLALEEEGKTLNDIRKAFKLPLINSQSKITDPWTPKNDLEAQSYLSINEINKEVWDGVFKNKGTYNWESLKLLEEAFSNNNLKEENWKFYYLIVRDKKEELVLATFFTEGLFKDDLLTETEVSKAIEEIRLKDKYHLSSEALMMGSLFTEGEHLYVNRGHKEWKAALKLLNSFCTKVEETERLNNVILRDFDSHDTELSQLLNNQGYFKLNMPNRNIIYNLKDKDEKSFIQSLTSRSRRHVRNDVFRFQNELKVTVSPSLSEVELKRAYQLYLNVSKKNVSVNLFPYPYKLFHLINKSPDWEFIKIVKGNKLVSVGFCFKSADNYFPVLVGIDYNANKTHKVYKQMLYQVVKRAIALNYDKVYFGMSADTEKRKLGAIQESNVAFVEVRDNYNFETINNLTFSNGK